MAHEDNGEPPVRRSRRNLAKQAADFLPASITPEISLPAIATLPASELLTTKLTSLPKRDITLLQRKQRLLRLQSKTHTSDAIAQIALAATLVFAQEEAGTAVCISPTGLLLTCAHCVAESPADYSPNERKYLLFASGRAVSATCIAYDAKRDLALLRIAAAQQQQQQRQQTAAFASVPISADPPRASARLICVGHPGSEDLEAAAPGQKTGYDVLHVSFGRYRGIADGADVQDNSEIGALMHDCWTYWGHSGAPLCLAGGSGGLVGVHSSWDDETGMRRGVAWEAVVAFLRENGHSAVLGDVSE
ncbi:hypothetical protein DRE_02793 [Drechslerella stenobrocha 248]|uniref:AT hook domain-containing protein n=1 Tax=Drechslerella stenobrocha 248 TaxID=1043628 RepID=W7HUM1_9PEZI|nr:hypothetical protein DRE_02793 [Drechslerella stenobrocha 248]